MNTHRGIAPIIIALILAVILGGGYAAYKQYAKEYDYGGVHYKNGEPVGPASYTSVEKVEAGLSRARLDIQTKDWKTYRNERYGFEFRYPSEAKITGRANGTILVSLPIEPGTTLGDKTAETVIESNGSSCLPLVGGKQGVSPDEVKVINGIPFSYAPVFDAGAGSRYEGYRYGIVRNNTCVGLLFGLHYANYRGVVDNPPPDFNGPKEKTIFGQILSTFKFTK